MDNLAYADEDRGYEIIDGKVYALARPVPKHSTVSYNIISTFFRHLEGKPCKTYQEVDVHLDEKTNVVPDVLIVCDPEKVKPDAVYGAPDLVVEILSPSTARRDRKEKMHAYAKAGVQEYWLVSYAERSVEVYLPRLAVEKADGGREGKGGICVSRVHRGEVSGGCPRHIPRSIRRYFFEQDKSAYQ